MVHFGLNTYNLFIYVRNSLKDPNLNDDPVRYGELDCGSQGGDFLFIRHSSSANNTK